MVSVKEGGSAWPSYQSQTSLFICEVQCQQGSFFLVCTMCNAVNILYLNLSRNCTYSHIRYPLQYIHYYHNWYYTSAPHQFHSSAFTSKTVELNFGTWWAVIFSVRKNPKHLTICSAMKRESRCIKCDPPPSFGVQIKLIHLMSKENLSK